MINSKIVFGLYLNLENTTDTSTDSAYEFALVTVIGTGGAASPTEHHLCQSGTNGLKWPQMVSAIIFKARLIYLLQACIFVRIATT